MYPCSWMVHGRTFWEFQLASSKINLICRKRAICMFRPLKKSYFSRIKLWVSSPTQRYYFKCELFWWSGRVLGGIGMGLTFSITSVYLMDISSPAYRGILGVFPPLLTQVRRSLGFRDPRGLRRSSGSREILGSFSPSTHLDTTFGGFSPFLTQVRVPPVILSITPPPPPR